MIDFIIDIDKQLFLFLNGLHSDFFDPVMYFISKKEPWYPLYFILVLIIVIQYRLKAWMPLLLLVLAIVSSELVSVHLLKETVQRLRPCKDPALSGLVHIVNGHCGGNYGFVSTHASDTFAGATFISLIMRVKPMQLFMFAWAFLISYSRIYLGVHYPMDVFFGALLGVLIGYGAFKLVHLLNRKYLGSFFTYTWQRADNQ
jgi:undecaprenyl-diphosphatase